MSLVGGARLGPYEIVAALGAGGMGAVYKARDTRLGRTVAVKVLLPAAAADATQRARFEREARAISRLSHPHLCTLYDLGREVPSDVEAEGGPVDFLVMEYLEGQTLAAPGLDRGRLPRAVVAGRHATVHLDFVGAARLGARPGLRRSRAGRPPSR